MKAYTDGACRGGNPGTTSCAWVLYLPNGTICHSEFLGPELHTNNYAEYMGVLTLLRHLYVDGIANVDIFCDSKLVVEQINGRWKQNSQELKSLRDEAYALLVLGKHTLAHIPGHSGEEGNETADQLCNEELDKHIWKTQSL